LFGDADFAWLNGLRGTHYPRERNRVPAHLTLFHQLPPSAERELTGRLATAANRLAPRASVAGIMDLGEGTALRIESAELEEIRADLADGLFGMLTQQDGGRWNPHITIQNKVASRAARQLQQQLGATFEPRPLRIRGLASWRYLGGPWEPIRQWSFRG
jgi:hypothetical protein